MTELGRWLTYEAVRDWLPHRRVPLHTDLASTEGEVVDAGVALLALPILPAGLGLWNGAQTVLPAARVAHLLIRSDGRIEGLPEQIDERMGVLVFSGEVATGERLEGLLTALASLGVRGRRLRVISALTASPGLKRLGETNPDLTLYTACIDAELSSEGRIVPGIGSVPERLYGTMQLDGAAAGA
ncbi:uracil phosphoribosyltransferase [Synechococcus sp. GFB01]|uniref:uracil phosphoribosyltransferase n=1 Tax=Synechococcus sp. GFB01 TaxID=1662190 RepID=UPI0035101FB5